MNVEEWVDQQIEDLQRRNIIRESNSPWSAPIVVVTKKSGDFRLCVDYRRLNSITVRPIFNIPDTKILFDSLAGSKLFSCIDLSNAYYQCEVQEEHKKYTAFATRKGHYEFNRMPFGLSGAPFTFQRLMQTVLKDESWEKCLIYLDDVIIFGRNFEDHCKNLNVVLEKIEKAGLKLSAKKCSFFLPRIKYLGHIISSNGIETDNEKINDIKNWPKPATVTELRSFLGFANYYRRFIHHFSNKAQDLEEILVKSSKEGSPKNDKSELIWNEKASKAFTALKDSLCSAPCLAFKIHFRHRRIT